MILKTNSSYNIKCWSRSWSWSGSWYDSKSWSRSWYDSESWSWVDSI